MSSYYADTVNGDSPSFVSIGSVGSDGTLIGSPSTVTGPTTDSGDFGYQFDGATEYIDTGLVDSPDNGSGPFTIELWVMPKSGGSGGCLVGGYAGGTNPSVQISLGSSGTYAANIGGAVGSTGFSDASYVRTGEWNHVVVTFDGATATLYINGVVSQRVGTTYSPASSSYFLIGALGSGTGGADTPASYCDAAIADVSFYQRMLEIQDIIDHFSARSGEPAFPSSSTFTGDYWTAVISDNPRIYYRCDETSGARAIDRSGNGYDGAYGLGDFEENEPGAIYDGDAAILLTEPIISTDEAPAGVCMPVIYASMTTQFSVECWVEPTTLPALATVCATTSPSAGLPYGLFVAINTDGTVKVGVGDGGFDSIGFTSPDPLPTGQYNHIVLTFDGSTVILYVNGSAVASHGGPSSAGNWATNLCWGFGGGGNQLDGSLDEIALYNYALTPDRVYVHYVSGLGPITPPPAPVIAGDDRHYFLVQIYDDRNQLVDIPQADIESLSLSDTLNGGSSSGTLTFVRDFNSIGAINYLWRVLVWIWWGQIAQPVNPTWAGYMVDIDQEKTRTLGKITVHLEGDQKQLDRAAVYEDVNPLVNGNPPLDAADYIRHLYNTYAPPGFCSLSCPATLFPLLPGQYEMMQLGDVIDTVLKTGRDDLGNLVIWRVNCAQNLQRTLLVEPDQNPNTIEGLKFKVLFIEQMAKYAIHTKYSEICNVVTIQGGQNYITGLPVVGSFIDVNSVAAFGAWEQIISVWQLIDQSACDSYAESFLDIHGNPQAMGEIELHNPDPSLLSGVWIQIWENATGGGVWTQGDTTPPSAATIKQMRISSVKWEVGRSRIAQTLTPQAPTPYLDYAVYRTGFNTANNGINQITNLPVNNQFNFVRAGGEASHV